MAKKKTKEEIERALSQGNVAIEFARLVCLAKPSGITPFLIEEPYSQPALTPGEPSEARAVVLKGVFVGERRAVGGIVAFEDPVRGCAPCVGTNEIAQLVQRWREEPYNAPPAWFGLDADCAAYGALLRAFTRLADRVAERQEGNGFAHKVAS